MEKMTTPRKLRYASGTRKSSNRHSTGREKKFVNPYAMKGFIAGINPIFTPQRKKLKGWQTENRRRAA